MAQYVYSMIGVGKTVPPGKKILRDISLSFFPGAKIGVLGLNGSGKSTLLRIMAGIDLEIDGEAIPQKNLKIGYLSQEPSIFGKLSVEDNLKLILEMTKFSKKEQQDKIDQLLEELSISHLRKNKGNTLSGGERRRVEICRTLSMDPNFILLDEPFAGIDPIAVEDIQQIVRSLKDRNIGVLITDHNVRETLSITDRSYLLFDGRILNSGTSEFLANDEEARRLYLGEKFRLD